MQYDTTCIYICAKSENHDISFDNKYYERGWSRFHRKKYDVETRAALKRGLSDVCTYLEDSASIIEGYKVYGSPWQPEFCDWAFNLERGQPCRDKWKLIPDDTDVLITHGPPHGHGRRVGPG